MPIWIERYLRSKWLCAFDLLPSLKHNLQSRYHFITSVGMLPNHYYVMFVESKSWMEMHLLTWMSQTLLKNVILCLKDRARFFMPGRQPMPNPRLFSQIILPRNSIFILSDTITSQENNSRVAMTKFLGGGWEIGDLDARREDGACEGRGVQFEATPRGPWIQSALCSGALPIVLNSLH
jgi:hypothetical protein